jgi:hypothetical protein
MIQGLPYNMGNIFFSPRGNILKKIQCMHAKNNILYWGYLITWELFLCPKGNILKKIHCMHPKNNISYRGYLITWEIFFLHTTSKYDQNILYTW